MKPKKPNRFHFRGWETSSKRMVDPNDFEVSFNGYVESLFREGLIQHDDIILMQSTGLADKNGKEIFEGDILKDDWIPHNTVVKYDDAFVNEGDFLDIGFCIPCLTSERCEVIGNIYENPELLEKP